MSPGSLSVSVVGVKNDVGRIIILIFDDPEAFDAWNYGRAVAYRELAAMPGVLKTTFSELSSGPFAVNIFHDEDGDYDLKMNGDLPQDGYGTSGAEEPYDVPSFSKASVIGRATQIRMHYLN